MLRGWSSLALLCAVSGALLVPAGVNARAPGVKTLTDVGFAATADRIEFTLTADGPLDPAGISARRDGPVLMIRVDDIHAERRWLDTPDALVKRTLLHPSRKHAPAAVVRTRLTRRITGEMLENIRVRQEGDRVVVAVPRSPRIARAWASSPAPIVAAPAPTDAVTLTVEAGAEQPIVVPAALAAVPGDSHTPPPAIAAVAPEAAPAVDDMLDPADTPLGFGEDALLDRPRADVALTAGLARPDGPGMAAFLMSLAFLGAVGLLMWRKMRGNRSTSTGRPIIRPVGSHMLGPKQSLLLVDVAGEMLLLGTTDKGVQMLTKIEGRDRLGEPAGPPIADAADPGGTFAERLGAAVSRFRTAASRIEPPEPVAADPIPARDPGRRYATMGDAVEAPEAEPAAADSLAALAERVEDSPRIRRRQARTRFAPIEPAAEARPSAPPLDPTADLLRKIRSLQQA